MKKILFFLVFINFISKTIFANIPLEQYIDLYHNTKDKYKTISPAWAEVMLQSGHLKNIRFFGHFSSDKHPNFEPHPSFAINQDRLNYNAPQDAISALLQYLFTSPNGQVLAINQRQNDPIGQLSKKTNLPLISNLIQEIIKYKNNNDVIALKNEIAKIIEATRSKNDKSKKTRAKFDPIRDQFIDILIKAVLFEDQIECQNKYPAHTIINALFAFALTSADHINEIYSNFKWIFVDSPKTYAFTKEDYKTLVAEISKDPNFEKGVDTEKLIRALFGQVYFEQILPAPLTYINSFYMHQGKKIVYPNCGETSLLNFFYYLWGDKGVINPSYIETTEQKLRGNLNENWQKLKEYFLEFATISSSTSRIAQERWSHLISNLNKYDTHPSLKITYRQEVCNVQGIGVINILNVFEKIIPDNVLSTPFSNDEEKKLEEASIKFNRLATLFSRENALVDWHVAKEKKIKNKITDLIFSINNEERFIWKFIDQCFEIERINNNEADWRKNCEWKNTPILLKAWVRSEAYNLCYTIEHPNEIYALNLLSTQMAGLAIDKIIANKWVHLKSLIPQIIGKTLYVNDKEAQHLIYTLLHFNNGIIDGQYYPEFDWKTYIPNFEPLTKYSILTTAAKKGYWHILQRYSIEDNIDAGTPAIATKKGYLPFIQWICETNPEAKNDKRSYTPDLVDLAIQNGHFDILDYLNPPFDCKTKKGKSLLHLYAASSYDTTEYINTLLKNGIKLNIINNQEITPFYFIDNHTHINNIKLLIDKMIETNASFHELGKNGHTIFSHIAYNTYPEAFFYLIERIEPFNWIKYQENSLLHHIVRRDENLEITKFLIEKKGFNVTQLNQFGDTPLHRAAQNASIETIKYLVEKLEEKGSKIDIKDDWEYTPLHLFLTSDLIKYGSTDSILETTKFFIKKGSNVNTINKFGSAPFKIILNDSTSLHLIRGLIELGALTDFNDEHNIALHNACGTEHTDGQLPLVQYLIEHLNHPLTFQDTQLQTPLHRAVTHLDLEIIDYLLSKGADPHAKDANGQTPLHLLSQKHNKDDNSEIKALILKRLLNAGANINERDEQGRTILLLTLSKSRHNEMFNFIKILLENGSDLYTQDNGDNNVLHHLFSKSYNDDEASTYMNHLTSFLTMLRQKGFNLEEKNTKGETPLSRAFLYGNLSDFCVQKIETLINMGADIKTRDNEGNTLLHKIAQNEGYDTFMLAQKYVEQYHLDVTAKNNEGKEALSYTTDKDLARYLINKGADQNLDSIYGETWAERLGL